MQMDNELQQFNIERAERLRIKHEKHSKELEAFDNESIALGFRWAATLDTLSIRNLHV